MTDLEQRRPHCKQGHPYTGRNLVLLKASYGRGTYRRCRECFNRKNRERRAIQKETP